MREKKAQITLLFIVGLTIFILLIGGVLFALAANQGKIRQAFLGGISDPQQAVNSYVVTCLQEALTPLTYASAARGGQLRPRTYPLSYEAREFTVAYDASNTPPVLVPSKGAVEEELEDALTPLMHDCLDSFHDFEAQKVRVTAKGNPAVKVTINRYEVTALLEYPLVVESGEKRYDLREFQAHLDANLGELHEAFSAIALEAHANPQTITEYIDTLPFESAILDDRNNVLIVVMVNPNQKAPMEGAPLVMQGAFIFRENRRPNYLVQRYPSP